MLAFLSHKLNVWKSIRHEKQKEKTRSTQWPAVRDEYVREKKKCESCDSTERLQVHHVEPFHLRPDLELSKSNFIAMCMGENECHLKIGHGDDFKAYNPDVRLHAARAEKHPHLRFLVEQDAKMVRKYDKPR